VTSRATQRAGAWTRARELAETTPAARNRYVDFLRAASIAVVVLGHWLMAAPVLDRDELTLSDMLHIAPWTQWLTWLFQVMPLFFIVGGFANGVSWDRARERGLSVGTWLAARLRRLVGPIIPLLVFWAALAIAARQFEVRPDILRIASQAALIPTWFLAVYVLVIIAVPATHAFWRRFGPASFWLLVAGAVAVDAIGFGAQLPLVRWVNYAFVWLGVHHLGYLWHYGHIRGPAQSLAWAAGGLAVLALLVGFVGYPTSMITVPGEAVSNSRPPTLALLALGVFQLGLVLSVEAPVRRWLGRVGPWTATVLVNGTIMTLYLWHVTALVLVVGAANLLGGVGLGLAPASGEWWLARLPWIAVLSVALWPLVLVFGRFEQRAHRPGSKAPETWRMLVGAAAVCAGLAFLAMGGIADADPLGIRFRVVVLTLAGAALILAPPFRKRAAS
jgi:fucose 4-O-acetylase-like acetyltransferase